MSHLKTHLRTEYAQIIRRYLIGEKTKGNRGNTREDINTTLASQLQKLINQLRNSKAIQTPLIGTYIAD